MLHAPKIENNQNTLQITWLIILIGFTSIITQVILMRELVVIFYGHELSLGTILGTWLFFTALGSSYLPRILPKNNSPRKRIGFIQISFLFILPSIFLLLRSSKTILKITPGEMIGFIPSLVITICVLAPFCLLAGLLYTTACQIVYRSDKENIGTIGKVYFLEAIGSGIGGVLSSFILIVYATPVQILLLLILLNFISGLYIGKWIPFKYTYQRILWIVVLLLFIGITGYSVSEQFQLYCDRILWKGYSLILSKNTPYGNITVTRMGDQFSFFENGVLMFNSLDRQAAEESVHFTLLEHPHPTDVLLVGGGLGGGLNEILLHQSVKKVDYVELDPASIQLAKTVLPCDHTTSLKNPRVHLHHTDARHFLKTSTTRYDVIIIALPNPYTAQINRFYTIEFFHEVLKKLNSGGIFSLQVASSENAISPELSDFLSTISETLGEVFPYIIHIPGETVRFICSNQSGVLTSDTEKLIQRLKNRNLKTLYVSEHFMPYQMSEERQTFLQSHLHAVASDQLNRDFKPIGYLYDTILWATYFSSIFKVVFIGFTKLTFLYCTAIIASISLFLILIYRPFKNRSRLFSAGILFSIFGVGFTEISLEVILILAFQILYGFAYQQMALIIAGYMAGLTLGSRVALSSLVEDHKVFRYFQLSQAGMSLFPFVLTAILWILKQNSTVIINAFWIGYLFTFCAALSGIIGGFQFPLANRLYLRSKFSVEKSAGFLYGFDLFGSSAGALITSAFLVPILGIFQTLFLLSIFNLCSLFMILLCKETVPTKELIRLT